MNNSPLILFVSHLPAKCGVHKFGANVAKALEKSSRYDFRYVESGSARDHQRLIHRYRPRAVIYNHHPETMSWLDDKSSRAFRGPRIGIMHEVTQQVADTAEPGLFDFYIAADPTLLLKNPIVFKTGRLVPKYRNRHPMPSIPTIGSFGFGTAGKGFERLVEQVQSEFDRAVIRLQIPFATFGDADGKNATEIVSRCRTLLKKPGISLDVNHDFLTDDELVEFLGQNSLNAFLYAQQSGRGISSVIDYALAARRPIAVTRSSMFRHIIGARPPITIDDARLSEILGNGVAPLSRYIDEWTAEDLIWDYERIVDSVLAARPILSRGTQLLHGAIEAAVRVLRPAARTLAPAVKQADKWLKASGLGQNALSSVRSRPMLRRVVGSMRSRLAPAPRLGGQATNDWTPEVRPDRDESAQRESMAPYRPAGEVKGGFNRILDRSAFEFYQPAVDYLFRAMPGVMARKIPAANIQQAFVLDTVARKVAAKERPAMLCVGSYEDTAAGALMISGYEIEEVDPVINYDLATFLTKPSCKREHYDAVFATSVIEHVADDESFVRMFEELLAPNGVGVLTCDFNDQFQVGDPIPKEDRRLYTKRDLKQRLLSRISHCQLVDEPHWECDAPDFEYGGCKYTFATFVFQKVVQ